LLDDDLDFDFAVSVTWQDATVRSTHTKFQGQKNMSGMPCGPLHVPQMMWVFPPPLNINDVHEKVVKEQCMEPNPTSSVSRA